MKSAVAALSEEEEEEDCGDVEFAIMPIISKAQ
jgi:hypothetical protein